MAIAVTAAGTALVAGCGSTPAQPSDSIDVGAATNALWDPCALSVDAVGGMGMDPSTKHPDAQRDRGSKQCTWHDVRPAYTYDATVASSIYSIDDLRKRPENTDFTRVDIGG